MEGMKRERERGGKTSEGAHKLIYIVSDSLFSTHCVSVFVCVAVFVLVCECVCVCVCVCVYIKGVQKKTFTNVNTA